MIPESSRDCVRNPGPTLPIVHVGLGDGYNDYPGRQLLLHALSSYTPVIILRWRDPGEGLLRGPYLREVRPGIFELRNAFSLRNSRLGRLGRGVGRLDGTLLRRALRSEGIGDFIYWLSVPEPRLLWVMPTHRLVYDCVDPCFIPERQGEFDRKEFAVAKKAKVVFCTARALLRRLSRVSGNISLLPNACAKEYFGAGGNADPRAARKLEGRKRPIIGYMGTLDWRFDVESVRCAAEALPDYSFALVGRLNKDQEERISPLAALPNVVMVGPVSREEGVAYNAAFDVGIIPFTPGPMNDAINPVKMYMYLAAGKPVVSTHIEEASDNSDLVRVARSPEAFAELIRAAVESDNCSARLQRRQFGLSNTWDDRALEAIRIMEREGWFNPKGDQGC